MLPRLQQLKRYFLFPGMCVGSYFWGNLADARGRKKAIIGALLLDALAAFLSSVVQTFPAFLACRYLDTVKYFCALFYINTTLGRRSSGKEAKVSILHYLMLVISCRIRVLGFPAAQLKEDLLCE